MELAVLAGLAIVGLVAATPIVAVVAYRRSIRQAEELERIKRDLTSLRASVRRLGAGSEEDVEPGGASMDEPPAPAPGSPAAPIRGIPAGPPPRPPAPTARTRVDPPRPAPSRPVDVQPTGTDGPARAPLSGAAEVTSTPGTTAPPEPVPAGASAGRPAASPRSTGGASDRAAAARTAVDFEAWIGGTWLLRVGLGILAIALALFARSIVPQLPPAAKVALAYAGAMALFATGKAFETRLARFARPVMAAGLTFGFFVAFAAHFVPAMRSISMLVSIAWMVVGMITVLIAAERWESPLTAALALVLGHVSALVVVGSADLYSLVMIAFLAVTATALVLRHAWSTLGVLAAALAYGSHVFWLMADRDPVQGDPGFWLSLSFLTVYYAVFLIGDVLWWHRDADRETPLPEDEVRAARQLGPINLVLVASVASLVYLTTGAGFETIEWFYLTLGAAQGALAWYYWGVGHRDFAFYPAFGTALWTLGLFAALDAVVLNLVLSVQALLLLLVAHQTRLRVFHWLAQLALVVAFVHYLAYPTTAQATWPLLLGGLGIAGVYLLKASLEEIWYEEAGAVAGAASGLTRADEPTGAGFGFLGRWAEEAFAAVAPALATWHAGMGGFVLVREIIRHFGMTPSAAWALLLAYALVVAIVLLRRRDALLLAFTVGAAAGPYVAATADDGVVVLTLLDGLVVIALVLAHLAPRRMGAARPRSEAHAQAAVMLALLGAFVALAAIALTPSGYFAALTLPALVLLFEERVRRLAAPAPAGEAAAANTGAKLVRLLAGVAAAVVVVFATVNAIGAVANGLVWTAVWSAALVVSSALLGSAPLFVAGYVLMLLGYASIVALGSAALPSALDTLVSGWWITIVPLTMALGLDRRVSGDRGGAPSPSVGVVATYLAYGLGLALLAALAEAQLPEGWWLALVVIACAALASGATALGMARAIPSVAALLIVLHLFVAAVIIESAAAAGLLWPLVAFALTTLVAERALGGRRTGGDARTGWEYAALALVVLATWTAMAAVYQSAQLGTQWATAGWSVLGVSMMVAGFALRSGLHRRVALIVLGVCLLRVFVVDTRGLSDGARTVAFLVLGLCLVGAAWLYARYAAELKSWL